MGKLIGTMLLFVAVGSPMVWYLWERLNELLNGEFYANRLLVAIPVLLVFVGLLVLVSRTVQKWDAAG
jgi:hypothetical protein